ncbi:hypothetical protein [Actibacterium ureilyticum]|uniref:hypothetical protein n=1 Tax=Actibacterium ureilyticum TaxID=1590614 RepID=UPI000BAA9BE9|nr:hypothetical protein [Actibacterium ureilyticum]
MQYLKFMVAVGCAAVLAGCQYNDSERAVAGAAAGAVVAGSTGNNVLVGAGVGAAGGALCDDAGLC